MKYRTAKARNQHHTCSIAPVAMVACVFVRTDLHLDCHGRGPDVLSNMPKLWLIHVSWAAWLHDRLTWMPWRCCAALWPWPCSRLILFFVVIGRMKWHSGILLDCALNHLQIPSPLNHRDHMSAAARDDEDLAAAATMTTLIAAWDCKFSVFRTNNKSCQSGAIFLRRISIDWWAIIRMRGV